MRNSILTAAMVIGLSAAAARAGDSYPIRLSVPAHVGDAGTVSLKETYKRSEKWTDADKRKPVEEQFEVVLEGVETVDAVSDNGHRTKVTVKVTRCNKDGHELLPSGAVLTAETVNGATAYKVDGVPASEDERKTLGPLVLTARPDEPTLDQERGTDQPRKVGESWPENGDQLAKATRLPFHLTGDDFKGEATLVDVKTADGKSTETIHLTDTCTFDSRPGTDGKTYTNLKMKFEDTLTVPTDLAAGVRTSTYSRTVTNTVTGPDGTKDVKVEWTSTSTYTPAKKPGN